MLKKYRFKSLDGTVEKSNIIQLSNNNSNNELASSKSEYSRRYNTRQDIRNEIMPILKKSNQSISLKDEEERNNKIYRKKRILETKHTIKNNQSVDIPRPKTNTSATLRAYGLSELSSKTKLKYNLTLDDLKNESMNASYSNLHINTLNDTNTDSDINDTQIDFNPLVIQSITPTGGNQTEFNLNNKKSHQDENIYNRLYKKIYSKDNNNQFNNDSVRNPTMHSSMDSMSEIRSCIESVHFDDENDMLKFKEDIFNKLKVPKGQSFKNNTLKLDMIDLRSYYNNILVQNKKMKKQKMKIDKYIHAMDDENNINLNLIKHNSNASSDNSNKNTDSNRTNTNNHVKKSLNNAISNNRKVLGQLDLNSTKFLNDYMKDRQGFSDKLNNELNNSKNIYKKSSRSSLKNSSKSLKGKIEKSNHYLLNNIPIYDTPINLIDDDVFYEAYKNNLNQYE